MRDLLHPLLLALTLLDLVFVGVTGVVPGYTIAPLVALALASPWLRRLQRHALYRAAWNTGVLVIFAMLVRHAATTGLLHMLEDGLLLAVLCQVHLLNNVGERQRPDLVFFNSFLIAFVTSFFAPSVSWSILFVAHALVFVPALQINVIARRSGSVDWSMARGLLRDSLPKTATIGFATVVVFAFFPRDFHHEGWLGNAIAQHGGLGTGIDEMIRLDDERAVQLSNSIVMRIRPTKATSIDVPAHWRTVVFAAFDGRAWRLQDAGNLGSRFATDPPWDRRSDGNWTRPSSPMNGRVEVQLIDPSAKRLPLPLTACAMAPTDTSGLLFDPKSYGGFAFFRLDDAPATGIEYSVRLAQRSAARSISQRTRAAFLELPRRGIVRTTGHLAEQLRGELADDANHRTIAHHAADWLRDNRRYQLPGGQGFAGSIAGFAIGSGAGHCEYLATVLALLLRHQGVPCRLVGGYLAQERADDGTIVVRSKHAHAWVEALLPDGSWLTLDATPASEGTASTSDEAGWWHAIGAELERYWDSVVGFDEQGRAELLAALGALPVTLGRFALAHPVGSLGLLALPFALLYARRRQRRLPLAVVSLVDAARAAGIDQKVGETPREMLARAQASTAADNRVETLAVAVRQHELIRYGGAKEADHEA